TERSRVRFSGSKRGAIRGRVYGALPAGGVSRKPPAYPSKPHPRPLSRGERGDYAERVELVGCAMRTFDVGDGAHSAPYGNPARLSPPSPPGRGAGGEASKGRPLRYGTTPST